MKPARRALVEQFRMFNADHFGGALPAIPVHLCWMNHYGDYSEPCERWPSGLIRLSSKESPRCTWRGVLLHEMVHAALWFDDEWHHGEVEHHGPRFTALCNVIGARLGLPAVALEESWAWPWIVHFAAAEPAAA